MEEVKKKPKLSLSVQMLLGMILGIIVGLVFGEKISFLRHVGNIFMRSLLMCIYPLIFTSIIKAVSSVSDLQKLRKIGGMFIGYIFIGGGIAAALGVIVMMIIRPGTDLNWDLGTVTEGGLGAGTGIIEGLIGWIPQNPFSALSNGNLVQIVFFGIVFGLALSVLHNKNPYAKKVIDVIDILNETMLELISGVLKIAPIGIFAMMANMIGTTGFEVLQSVGGFFVAFYIVIALYSFVFIPVIIKFGAKLSPIRYYKNIAPVILFAISSLSSVASIPMVSRVTKENCGVRDEIVDLITPPAATINQHAAAAEFACYIMFASFIYNLEMSIPQIILTVFVCIIASLGAAGIPGGGIVMGTIALNIMGLPPDIVTVIAGAYVILDYGATVVNITGDTTGMVYIAARVGELDKEKFYSKNVV